MGTAAEAIPPAVQALAGQAMQALQAGQAAEAERHLLGALALAPQAVDLLRLLGIAQHRLGRHAEAVATLRRALVRRPDDALIHNSLGAALDAYGEHQSAIDSYRRASELAPQVAAIWNNLGKALADRDCFDEAVAALQRAVTLDPALAAPRFSLAYALKNTGRAIEAASQYRAILQHHPGDGDAWLGLADLKTLRFDADDLAELERRWRLAGPDAPDRIPLGFAFARALETHARCAEAFAILGEVNAAVSRSQPWDAAAQAALVALTLAIFAAPGSATQGDSSQSVVFIVGLPRSGSSLIEQILASHPEVAAAGEIDDLGAVIAEESTRRGSEFPAWAGAVRPADWESLGARYLARIAPRRGTRAYLTDKRLGNWLYLGAALAMLPGARVIDCRRDPVETCLSCFRQRFAPDTQSFSYDLGDLAAYWRDYDRAMRHWATLYPLRIHTQCYEELLRYPVAEIRAMLAFCGLDFDDRCLRFHQTERAVKTLSAAQVRAPLMRDTARAAQYGALLDPLRRALAIPSS